MEVTATDEKSIEILLKEFWLNFIKCDQDSEEWKAIVCDLIYDRVKKIQKFSSLISIYKSIFKQEEAATVVRVVTTVMEETIASPTFNQKELKDLASHPSKWSKTIFSRCLDEKYPNSDCGINIESVLEYEMWPVILTSYSGSDGEGFSEASLSSFQKLLGVMQHSQNCIISGSLTVNLFKEMERKWSSHLYPMLKLLKLDVKVFKEAMDSANNRILLFHFHEALLLNFINYLDKELNKEFKVCEISPLTIDDMYINELCVEVSEKSWKYPCLEAADPVKPLLIPFAVMTSEVLKNNIFHQQCKDQVKCLNNIDSWSQIAIAVKTAFESCTLILAKLKDQTITLHEVDTLFRGISSVSVVTHTLSQLESALLFPKDSVNFLKDARTFSSQRPPCSVSSIFVASRKSVFSSPWINKVATNVYLWRGLSPLLVEAQDFAKIMNDFEVKQDEFMEFFIIDLQTTELKSVANEKEEMLEFMKKTKEQTGEVKDSIRVFAKSKKLREWILAKSEDLDAMETFIGVVLDTLAEEGDEIQDRLTNLSELCSKFSLLIYNFDKVKSRIKRVMKLFEDTYKKLSDISDPVALVEICNNDFEWYKRIGELQGSIEQGAVTQLKEINQHGFYSIQSSGDSHKCRVSLSIVRDKKHSLSLDDLNELESKLVLITRKHSSWAEEKELFQE
uniref:Uncharacterized protein n=1 Tax=Amphimedon queenslandica TaxID=400682 RepID=A0A1X7SWU9_AMPQE